MVPSTTRERRFGLPDTEVLVLCGAAALGALLVILHAPAVARIPAGLILFALLPGAVLARLARRDPRVRLEDWLLQTITFSPPIVIAARALSTTVGLSWEAFAVALAAVLAGAALVVPAARVRGLEADRRVLAIGLAIGIAVALPAWVDLRTRVFGDALVHAQIVHELQLRGLPPQDPSYAGVPLTYMWLLHVGWAALGAATGLAPFYVFPLVNGLMAVALVMAARLGTEALGGGRSAQRAAAVVVPLGMNALGWLPAVAFTLGRAMIGHDRGAGVLAAGLRALLVAPDANGIASALLPGGYVVLASSSTSTSARTRSRPGSRTPPRRGGGPRPSCAPRDWIARSRSRSRCSARPRSTRWSGSRRRSGCCSVWRPRSSIVVPSRAPSRPRWP